MDGSGVGVLGGKVGGGAVGTTSVWPGTKVSGVATAVELTLVGVNRGGSAVGRFDLVGVTGVPLTTTGVDSTGTA